MKQSALTNSMFEDLPRRNKPKEDDVITADEVFPAKDANRIFYELNNVVDSAGELAKGYNEDPDKDAQVAKAIRNFASVGDYYIMDSSSSTGNIFQLKTTGKFPKHTHYIDGMKISFINLLENNDKFKISIDGLVAKNAYFNITTQMPAKYLEVGKFIEMQYISSIDGFVLVNISNNMPQLFKRDLGEIVHSLLPIQNAGLHLLDGEWIAGTGIYKVAYDYISGLQQTYPQLFCTEEKYEEIMKAYGQCGKFVIQDEDATYFAWKDVTNNIVYTLGKEANSIQSVYTYIDGKLSNIYKSIEEPWNNPTFTDYTSGNYTVSGNCEVNDGITFKDNYLWKMFDGSSGAYISPINSTSDIINFYSNNKNYNLNITQYSIQAGAYQMDILGTISDVFSYPSTWIFEGSKDGITWDVLDTKTNQTFSPNEKKEFTIDNTNYYRYYRIVITGSKGATQSAVAIDQITFAGKQRTLAVNKMGTINDLGNSLTVDSDTYALDETDNIVKNGHMMRIPTITEYIKGTNNILELCDAINDNAPDHKHYLINEARFDSWAGIADGTMGNSSNHMSGNDYWLCGTNQAQTDSGSFPANRYLSSEASKTNSHYGNGQYVEVRSIKTLVYMVLATEVKTDVEVNINNVANDLSLKANVYLTNLSAKGKELVTDFTAPSQRNIDITLEPSDSRYTAPANGYVFISMRCDSGWSWFMLYNETAHIGSGFNISSASQGPNKAFVPVKKGDVVFYRYGGNQILEEFKFIYLGGEE